MTSNKNTASEGVVCDGRASKSANVQTCAHDACRPLLDEELDRRFLAAFAAVPPPPAELDARVVERIAGLRSGVRRPLRSGAACTRRRFVLAGAAVAACAGVGLVGALRLGRDGFDETDAAVSGSSAVPSFSLQVARASEADTTGTPAPVRAFELDPTARGLVPVGTSGGVCTKFRMNFAVEGADVTSVAYRAVGGRATYTAAMSGLNAGVAYDTVRFQESRRYVNRFNEEGFVVENPDPAMGADELAAYLASDEVQRASNAYFYGDASVSDAELDIDYAAGIVEYVAALEEDGVTWVAPATSFASAVEQHAAGMDGYSRRGNPYLLVVESPAEEFYASDPVLALYRDYREAFETQLREVAERRAGDGRFAGQTFASDGGDMVDVRDLEGLQRVRDAKAAVEDALAELRRDGDGAFIDWMRSCYRTYLAMTADTLGRATLEVEATSSDGSAALRVYRIDPVEGFDGVVERRFDALLAYNGYQVVPGDGVFDRTGRRVELGVDSLPFWNFVAGEPDPDDPDPRLHEPLFAITDVTAGGAV